MNTMGNKRH